MLALEIKKQLQKETLTIRHNQQSDSERFNGENPNITSRSPLTTPHQIYRIGYHTKHSWEWAEEKKGQKTRTTDIYHVKLLRRQMMTVSVSIRNTSILTKHSVLQRYIN